MDSVGVKKTSFWDEGKSLSFRHQMRNCGKVKTLAKIALLSALAGVLMVVANFPLPFAPPFMKVDFADVPILIGGFALGPVAGVITVFIKIIINLIINGTQTAFVGEFSNFIVSSSYIFVASLYYQKHRTFKGAITGMILAGIVMSIVAVLSNAFLVFPIYAFAFGTSVNTYVDITMKLNPLVHSYTDLMLFAVLPFNIIKALMISIVTVLMYKKVSKVLKLR